MDISIAPRRDPSSPMTEKDVTATLVAARNTAPRKSLHGKGVGITDGRKNPISEKGGPESEVKIRRGKKVKVHLQ